MTKFFLEGGAQKKRHTADYRVLSYYKLLECIKKVRLFIIQRIVKKLRKEPTEQLEKQLAGLKGCHLAMMRKLAVYLLKHSCNLDLEKQQKFFESKLGCGVGSAIQEISESKATENGQLVVAVETHALFQQTLDEIQQLLGKVEKKISQTKHKKEIKKERVKARKQTKQVVAGEPIEQPKSEDEQRVHETKDHVRPKLSPLKEEAPRVKTRYDNRPKPRTEFKKKGRNKHLQKEKQGQSKGQDHEPSAPNPYLSANQSTHPSWQAKQQLSKIEPFQGKRILLS